ncbi:glycosyltransferase family 2 protein [Leucobacter sp. 1207-22]
MGDTSHSKTPFSCTHDVPDIDLIVAVHTPQRDIARAVGSALLGTQARVRVTVVCHNVSTEAIKPGLGALADDERVRTVGYDDALRSPAGPFNHGLDLATARYVAVLGSDDELESGALDSWLRVADASSAGAVIAAVRHVGGARVPSPPARPMRQRNLDLVRDRLSYRSAPLGLVSRAQFPDLRFTPGLRTGEDIAYTAALWSAAVNLAYDRHGPAYLIHADGAERVTTAAPPIAGDLEYLEPLLASNTFNGMDAAQRGSLLVKTMRSSLFGLLYNRPLTEQWPASERSALAVVTTQVMSELDRTPQSDRVFSRAERRLIAAMLTPDVSAERLLSLVQERKRFTSPGAWLTPRLRDTFRREAPVRFVTASFWARVK